MMSFYLTAVDELERQAAVDWLVEVLPGSI
jgi:hypothetical protein